MDPTPITDIPYGPWINTGAIVLSAVGVIATIVWNIRIAKRRGTLDVLLEDQTKESLIQRRTEFVKLRDAGHLAQWAAPEQTASEQATVIRAMLNRYELVAIGIRKGMIDEKTYKLWCRTTLVKDWMASKPFVMQLRQSAGISAYLCEFEWLAKRWANKDEKAHV